MKKIISVILALAMCAGAAVAVSGCGCSKSKKTDPNAVNSNSSGPGYKVEPTKPDFEEGDFGYYKLNDKEVKITEYKGKAKNVQIPATVSGAKVTVIESNLFQNSDIETVVIPEGVTEIQKYAFASCQNLKEVVIPEGVKTIGANAFWNCKNLAKVSLPKSLKKIDWNAFAATGLTKVAIPESQTLSTLSERVFAQCSKLAEVTIPVTITKITDDTFAECPEGLTIKALSGSYAVSYAKSHNIKVSEIER